MVDKILLLPSKARKIGLFDFKETYRISLEWLMDEGYMVTETLYKEDVKPDGSKEVDVLWEATKTISDYFKFLITIRFHPVPMTTIETEIDGVKQKVNKGDFTIEYKCFLIRDPSGQWGDNSFIKTLKRYYDSFMVKERQEAYEAKLIGEFNDHIEYVKSFLAVVGDKRV